MCFYAEDMLLGNSWNLITLFGILSDAFPAQNPLQPILTSIPAFDRERLRSLFGSVLHLA